ncbi:catechol 2,3-dioxygenase-like lactoylglutathione lyase family enzyme [Microbacterium resistens]|uniref:Catechol 2,3-dioxygenase-like lactoylglutathione lyase family enzyme n=1 Tax=Microbacterium resistens TaxID=156977 RepID=A0ABU1SAP5_9MICO|nr:VOC family protein [Microbacterium resistens]MDR6865927.1 catechol 2,3-dioxygenase-like lactoylglutathione lyase family enzyme [Microbacterium resistens]
MRVERVVPNLTVADLQEAVSVHSSLLGMRVVMDHGWIVTLADTEGHQLSLMTSDATGPVNPDVSVFVDDVRAAYARAQDTEGVEIVHPLCDEDWGVTRFFYRDGSGRVVNVGTHTRRSRRRS